MIAAVASDLGIGKDGKLLFHIKEDMAWFSCYAPYDNPQFAMCVCVEEGGSGSSVAAPLAGQIMDAAIQSAAGTLEEDMSTIAATEVSVGGSN